jgi:hypothetical protein
VLDTATLAAGKDIRKPSVRLFHQRTAEVGGSSPPRFTTM